MADHVLVLLQARGASSHSREVRDAMEHRCDVDRWSERTRSCIAEEPALDARRGCRETLTTAQRAALDHALAALESAPGATVAQVPAETAACSGAPVPACEDYCRGLMLLASCDKLPQQTRDVLRGEWAQVMAAWSQIPPDQLALACGNGVAAMTQMANNLRCTP